MSKRGKKLNQYQITADEEHLAVIMTALDLYFRIGMGQFDRIRDVGKWWRKWDEHNVGAYMDRAHELLTGLPKNAFHSIGSPRISDDFRQACEIYQMIRHRLSWDRNPKGGWTVNYDDPKSFRMTDRPLIEIERIESKQEVRKP